MLHLTLILVQLQTVVHENPTADAVYDFVITKVTQLTLVILQQLQRTGLSGGGRAAVLH